MMRKSSVMWLLAAVLLVGCGTVPVYEVIDAPVVTADSGYSMNDMRKAILKAGTALGWQMETAGNGRILATLHQRKATANAEIMYNRSAYSIRYVDSTNLKYDGGNIREGYNRWIRHLDKNIKTELIGL